MIIDVHQHLNFWDRNNEDFMLHQTQMGVTSTVLLPSDGTPNWYEINGYNSHIVGTEECYKFTLDNPNFYFGVNGYHRDPNIENILLEYASKGGKVIGELKFCEEEQNKFLQPYIKVAQIYNIPILMHFQDKYTSGRGKRYCPGLNIHRFEETLKENPDVNFIGHAVNFWSNIHGISGELLKKYDNLYADLSAGSCIKILKEKKGVKILEDFQDKLMFGSDCADPAHKKKEMQPYNVCTGKETVDFIQDNLNSDLQEKIFFKNATQLLKININENVRRVL